MFKKKTASRISLAVCAALLLTGLAGCGGDKGSSQGGSTGGSADGKVVTFPYTGEEIVFKGYGYEGKDQNPELLCQKAWKEHIGNIRIDWEFAAYSDYTEKIQIYLATNDIPDVMPIPNIMNVITEYGSTGMFLDFNKYADYMPNLAEYRKNYASVDYICTDDGARYGIVGIQPIDFAGESWFANMDVLNAAGVEVPDTFEEMLAAMRTIRGRILTSAPNRPYGTTNKPKAGAANSTAGRRNLGNNEPAAKDSNRTSRKPPHTRKDRTRPRADMYKEGLINSEIQTMSFEQEQNVIASGKWAFSTMYNGSPEVEIFKVQPGESLPFDIQNITPPADPNGNRYMEIPYQHDGIASWGLICSSKVEHPEYLAAYMDQVVSPYGRDIFNYGVEGVTYDVVDGVPTIKEGIDKDEYGVETQYEVWMVGMGPIVRTGAGYTLQQNCIDLNLKNFVDGTVKARFDPTFTIFDGDAGADKATIENALNTCIEENEAKFIYGIRDMSEWDAYVAELEKIANIDDLLSLYNNAKTIVRDPERIFVAK